MSIEALGAPGIPTRVAEALRQLHAGPRFRDDFDMFRTTERYLRVVDERAITIPTGYRSRLDRLPRIEAALAVQPLATVPCHNDLLAENYLDDGERLWLVDYEYSGNNDPDLRARQHVPGAGLGRGPDPRAVHRLLRRGHRRPARPDAAADDHVGRRLDALGGDPGRDLDDRLRLLRMGRGALGARADGARRARLRGLARRGRDLRQRSEQATSPSPSSVRRSDPRHIGGHDRRDTLLEDVHGQRRVLGDVRAASRTSPIVRSTHGP